MAFSGPAHTNAYSPHTGLSSMVLQRKYSQCHTGHMIKLYLLTKWEGQMGKYLAFGHGAWTLH